MIEFRPFSTKAVPCFGIHLASTISSHEPGITLLLVPPFTMVGVAIVLPRSLSGVLLRLRLQADSASTKPAHFTTALTPRAGLLAWPLLPVKVILNVAKPLCARTGRRLVGSPKTPNLAEPLGIKLRA